jgi:hypothetical protein
MKITHIVLYLFEENYDIYPCSNLEAGQDIVDRIMRRELKEQEFFKYCDQELVKEIIEALDEKRFGDAMKLYEESQYDGDERFIERFFIQPVAIEDIDKSSISDKYCV